MLIGLLSALVATVLNTVAGLLQADATTHVRRRRPLAVQPRYLVGLVVDGLGWVATVVALRHLPVFAVQAILGGAIALTALATRWRSGIAMRRPDQVAVVASVLGLLLVAGSAGGDAPESVGAVADLVLGGAVVVLAGVLVALRNCRAAWPFALVAGLGFGGTSLAVRAVHVPAGSGLDPGVLVAEPAAYLVLGFWMIGMISYSRALGRGDIAGVTAVFAITEVVVPGLIGLALLGDPVRAGWAWVLAVGLAVAVAGLVRLARLPAVRQRADHLRIHV
jgi:drug/metabolite transporter (DMT)-like permease